MITREEIIKIMKQKQGSRSLREFARELDVSAAYVCDVYLGRRFPGPAILDHFGIVATRRVLVSYNFRKGKK